MLQYNWFCIQLYTIFIATMLLDMLQLLYNSYNSYNTTITTIIQYYNSTILQ